MRIKNISKRKKILIIASSAFTISTIALGTTLYTTLKSKEIDNNPNENNMLNIKNNEKGKIFNDSNNFEKLNKKQDKLKNFKQNDSNIKSDNSKSNDSLKPTQPLLDSDKNKTDSKLIDNSNENNKLKSETQLDKNHFSNTDQTKQIKSNQNDSNLKSDNSKSNDSLKPTQPLLDSDKNKTDSKLIDNSNENNKLKSETQLDKNHFSNTDQTKQIKSNQNDSNLKSDNSKSTSESPLTQKTINKENNIFIDNKNKSMEYLTLYDAVKDAQDGETIFVNKDVLINQTIEIKKNIIITTSSKVSIKRDKNLDHPLDMFVIKAGGSLTLQVENQNENEIIFDGQLRNFEKSAMITVEKNAKLIVTNGLKFTNAVAKKTGYAIFKNYGHIIFNGAEASNSFSDHGSVLRNEENATFDFKSGKITNNSGSSFFFSKGTINIDGGEMTDNISNEAGLITMENSGVLNFNNGIISNQNQKNENAITLRKNSKILLGDKISIKNQKRSILLLSDKNKIIFNNNTVNYSKDNPLIIWLNQYVPGWKLLGFKNKDIISEVFEHLLVKKNDNSDEFVILEKNPNNTLEYQIIDNKKLNDLSLIYQFYSDNLGLNINEGYKNKQTIENTKNFLKEIYKDFLNSLQLHLLNQKLLENIENSKKMIVVDKNSIVNLLSIGSGWPEKVRTKQYFHYENVDILGKYLSSGKINKLNVFVDGNSNNVYLAARPVHNVKNNSYGELFIKKWKLKTGWNKLEIDLTKEPFPLMLFGKNDSKEKVRIRIDFQNPDSQNQEHPFFIYNSNLANNQTRFWKYLQELKEYNKKVKNNLAPDMTIVEFQDLVQGNFQLSISSVAIQEAYDEIGLTTEEKANAFIEKYAQQIFEWLSIYRKYDGYDNNDSNPRHHITKHKVHATFTNTVTSPSNLFAIEEYFHLPVSSGKAFINGTNMYEWGFMHEYGHTIDNEDIVLPEATNNLYAMEGAKSALLRKIKNENLDIENIEQLSYYHQNLTQGQNSTIAFFEKNLEEKIKNKEKRIFFFDDSDVFKKIYAWFIATSFFKHWDYEKNYDFVKYSFYDKNLAENIKKFGLYGTAMRLVREGKHHDKFKLTDLRGWSASPERLVIMFTIASGYDFSEIMQRFGQNNIDQRIKNFTSQYPKFPVPIEYYNLFADIKEIKEVPLYLENVKPKVEIRKAYKGSINLNIQLSEQEKNSTIAYEIYKDDELILFTRKNKNISLRGLTEKGNYRIVIYDYKLNKKESDSFYYDPNDEKYYVY